MWLDRWLRAAGLNPAQSKRAQPDLAPRRAAEARPPYAGHHAGRPKSTRVDGRLIFELDVDLTTRLRLIARAYGVPVERLAVDLLARGLEREARRAHVEAALASLTPREREVTGLTVQGRTNRQIAETLVISPETVKTHVRHVLDKLGARSKADLRLLLLELGVKGDESDPG